MTNVAHLFENAGIDAEPGSVWLTGARGSKLLKQLRISVHIMPLRRSRYSGADRVGATTEGYRLAVELESDIPVRFSIAHAGIAGARLITWVNRLKGLHRVPHVVTDLYKYEVWSSDADWATRLLDYTEVNTAIARLLACEQIDAKVGHPCVFVWPGKIAYYRRAAHLEGFNRLGEYLNDIATVCKFAQDMPPPLKLATATLLEGLSKKNQLLVGGLIVISGLVLFTALFGGLLWLIF